MNEHLTAFVSEQTGVRPTRLTQRTRLFHDLGMDGDDAVEFFEAFACEFDVDLSGMEWNRHFGPEGGCGCVPPLALIGMLVRRRLHEPMVPITLADLARAVSTGQWPDLSGRERE
jgi:acyl carrier protein